MTNNKLWGISLIIIGIAGLVFAVSNISGFGGIRLLRAMGAVQLLALPVLVFTTVKKLKGGK